MSGDGVARRRRIGVVTRRNGLRDLVLYDEDGEGAAENIALTDDEANAVGDPRRCATDVPARRPSPTPDFVLRAGDLVVTVGTQAAVDQVAHILDGSAKTSD